MTTLSHYYYDLFPASAEIFWYNFFMTEAERRAKQRAYAREWVARNPEKHRAYTEKYRQANWPAIREKRRLQRRKDRELGLSNQWIWSLRNKYGIEPEDYLAMVARQNGKCAICRRESPRSSSRRLFVDHCHSTGRVRGLLCSPCNSAIGLLREDAKLFYNAVRYLAGLPQIEA